MRAVALWYRCAPAPCRRTEPGVIAMTMPMTEPAHERERMVEMQIAAHERWTSGCASGVPDVVFCEAQAAPPRRP